MKNLFGDNRQANILSVLRKNSALNIEMLAQRFGVSERTVRNDIKDINRELKNSGLVEINQGKCSLRVFDTRDFQNAYARIIETDDLMNSSQKRQEYVFAKLMRAMEPVLTDDLAYEILSVVEEIPAGRVATYGQIAKLIGREKNSRLVAGVLSHAENYGKFPCHRVVNHMGRLAPGWTEQEWLLKGEGVTLKENGCVDLKKYLWEC